MKFSMKILCVLLALAGGSFASCFAAVLATKLAGGLKTDTWGMGEAYIFLFGAACGFIVGVIALIFAVRKGARFMTLMGCALATPCAVAFALFLSVTFLGGTLPRLCHEKRVKAIRQDVRLNSRFVERLVAKARAGTLGLVERDVLKEAVLEATWVLPSDEVPFLVESFMDDVGFVRSVLNNKKVVNGKRVINGDLRRRIYDRYKGQNCDTCPIVPIMASSAETPDDILVDIVEHNSRYPRLVRYDRNITDRAQETLSRKKAQRNP